MPSKKKRQQRLVDVARRKVGEVGAGIQRRGEHELNALASFDQCLPVIRLAIGWAEEHWSSNGDCNRLIVDWPCMAFKAFVLRYSADSLLNHLSVSHSAALRESNHEALGFIHNTLGHTEMRAGQYQAAKDHFEEAIGYFENVGNRIGKLKSMAGAANLAFHFGDLESAISLVDEVLAHETDPAIVDIRSELLGTSALAHIKKRRYEVAVQIACKAVDVAEDEENYLSLSTNLGDLAVALRHSGRVDEARDTNNRRIKVAKSIGDKVGLRNAYTQLANIAESQGASATAAQMHEKSLAISRELGDQRGEGADLLNIGVSLLHQERLDEALPFFEQALNVFDRLDDGMRKAICCKNMMDNYFRLGRKPEAIRAAQASVKLFKVHAPHKVKEVNDWLEEWLIHM